MEKACFETRKAIGYSKIDNRQLKAGNVFTLIELLIVIAIISILAAMLLPALKGAKDQAQSIVCVGNLRQLHLAVGMYANDYNSFFPQCYIDTVIHANQWTSAPVTWPKQLIDYLGGIDSLNKGDRMRGTVFQCPMRPDEYYAMADGSYSPAGFPEIGKVCYGSYCYNNFIGGNALNSFLNHKMGSVPPDVGLFGDGDIIGFNPTFAGVLVNFHVMMNYSWQCGIWPVHGAFVNIVCVDGHVEKQRANEGGNGNDARWLGTGISNNNLIWLRNGMSWAW